jgi:hypothetical protein
VLVNYKNEKSGNPGPGYEWTMMLRCRNPCHEDLKFWRENAKAETVLRTAKGLIIYKGT